MGFGLKAQGFGYSQTLEASAHFLALSPKPRAQSLTKP